MSKSGFQIFAEYGGKQNAIAERKKKSRGQADAFPELTIEDPTGDERYTTRETIEWCKARAGVDAFDLDVAACEESHWAPFFFTKETDGLKHPWRARRVWCNQPYSDLWAWVEKSWAEASTGHFDVLAMLIPATRTEQCINRHNPRPAWWELVEPFRDGRGMHESGYQLETHFIPGRTSFARPGSGGVGQSGAPFGCVLLVWRHALSAEALPTPKPLAAKKRRQLFIVDLTGVR